MWRYSPDFVAHKPDVFVMLFNNLYSTNFAQWIEGSWSSRVRLWVPENGQSRDESLIGSSWEARTACLAAVSDAPPGKLPPAAAGLVVSKTAGNAAHRGAVPASNSQHRGPLVTAFGGEPLRPGNAVSVLGADGQGGHVHGSIARRNECLYGPTV